MRDRVIVRARRPRRLPRLPWLSIAITVVSAAALLSFELRVLYGVPLLTLNGGVNLPFTHCGFEIWGSFGPFCNP